MFWVLKKKRANNKFLGFWQGRKGHNQIVILNKMICTRWYKIKASNEPTRERCTTSQHSKQVRRHNNGQLFKPLNNIIVQVYVCKSLKQVTFRSFKPFLEMIRSNDWYAAFKEARSRFEIVPLIMIYTAWVERNGGWNVKRVHTKNASKTRFVRHFTPCQNHTLIHVATQASVNLRVHITNKTISDTVRSLLKYVNPKETLWRNIVLLTAHLHIHIASSELSMKIS